MTALVIGASGLVGGHLLHALREAGETAVGTHHAHPQADLFPLDLQDREAVRRSLAEIRPEVVYLPASLTNVDYCETHVSESLATNVTAVRHVVESAGRIVFFSSDYVFDGHAGPYAETDPVNPLSVYGRHKVLAERSLGADALVVRTTIVYGHEVQQKNFVYRLVQTLSSGRRLRVPSDQVGSPSYAPELARAAVFLARAQVRGTYHVAGPEQLSRYEFALEAARLFGLDPELIEPVTTADLQQPAPRPLQAGLRVERAQAILPFTLSPAREGLRDFSRVFERVPPA